MAIAGAARLTAHGSGAAGVAGGGAARVVGGATDGGLVVTGNGVFDTVESPEPHAVSAAPSAATVTAADVSRCHTPRHGTGQLD